MMDLAIGILTQIFPLLLDWFVKDKNEREIKKELFFNFIKQIDPASKNAVKASLKIEELLLQKQEEIKKQNGA